MKNAECFNSGGVGEATMATPNLQLLRGTLVSPRPASHSPTPTRRYSDPRVFGVCVHDTRYMLCILECMPQVPSGPETPTPPHVQGLRVLAPGCEGDLKRLPWNDKDL